MRGTIIFRMEIKKELGGFAAASNFIIKLVGKKELCVEEVRGIRSLVRKDVNLVKNKSVVQIVGENEPKFLEITKPERLQEGCRDYQLVFCLLVAEEEIDDVVELQYYYLMKRYYKDQQLTAILDGSYDFYFKASHYFLDISSEEQMIYNSLFYNYAGKWVPLQKNNINKIKDFVPIQRIDAQTMKKFQKKCGSLFEKDKIEACLQGIHFQGETSPTFAGCLELLEKTEPVCRKIEIEKLTEQILNGNLLDFILFSYSFSGCMKTGKDDVSTEQVLQFYGQIRECSLCCQQLIENVVLHSTTGVGVLSIRFHSRKTNYLSKRYEGVKTVPYLEILITDYSGENIAGNLATNFVNNIKEEEQRKNFSELTPVDLIAFSEMEKGKREEEVQNAFKEYYSCSQNIGRHFGLRIFRNIIEENNGRFSFYSHDRHQIRKGESWKQKENAAGNQFAQCMPGTSYSILFPLEEHKPSISRAQSAIDENIKLQSNMSDYMEHYMCRDRGLAKWEIAYIQQEEKEKQIRDLADWFLEDTLAVDEKNRHVVYVSAENCAVEYAEYLCKALLIAGHLERIPDYVFYNCKRDFITIFRQTMNVYFAMGTMKYAFENKDFRIVLFSEKPLEETIIIPSSLKKTRLANRLCGFASGGMYGEEWLAGENYDKEEERQIEMFPYDILHDVQMNGKKGTLFEHYTLQILETDIQEQSFGCKIANTHMRLGSTIHINSFYEAELLFGNRMFISRFAYLLVKGISSNPDFKEAGYITLYSYALYSELLIFETMSILESIYPEKAFDYAILEREADHRTFSHLDRIRYSTFFESVEERKRYFSKRKIICIVPINSTLKTHEKLIDMFCRDNGENVKHSIIINYAIVLIGSEKKNRYWTVDEKERTFSDIRLQITPIPHYFVSVKVEYEEALGCKMCFPDNPLEETPLIEVNASSTVPDQSFGLYSKGNKKVKFKYEEIEKEETQLSVLKNALVYSHIERGENHFSFYFKTDQIFIENKQDIMQWLVGIANEMELDDKEYHVLVCPSHFSNAGFLECINKIIFHEAALVIRVDVDKEYRNNMEAKYSYLKEFVRILSQRGTEKSTVKVYFIDDSIVTGRTYYRAKSLISSVMGVGEKGYSNVNICIFDRIFVLLDRNSEKTRIQYITSENGKNRFLAYRTLGISSMRNHGDSCMLCQMLRQDDILYRSSATNFMAEHWQKQKEKFEVKSLPDKYNEEVFLVEENRGYRRMVCMHIAGKVLNGKNTGNTKEKALVCIVELLLTDYNRRKLKSQSEAFEYLISYVKVISRPFLAFSKAVREAVFDLLLIMAEYCLKGDIEEETYESLGKSKPYLFKEVKLLKRIKTDLIEDFANTVQKTDFLLVVMKQSMELRSNYFIRESNIRSLAAFANELDGKMKKEFYKRYLWMVKKLIGVNSDTSKSAWLNRMLSQADGKTDSMGLPGKVYELMIIENIRAYQDGLERLSELSDISKEMLEKEMHKFQYRDFKNILADYQWYVKEELSDSGAKSLAAGIELWKMVKEGQTALLYKIKIRML